MNKEMTKASLGSNIVQNTSLYSNSDGEQSSQASTIGTAAGSQELPKKFNHTKAQEIYEDVDFDHSLSTSIIKNMRSYVTLSGFISNSCREIVQNADEKTKDRLAPKLITLAEVINKGFGDNNVKQRIQDDIDFKDKSSDELFEFTLDRIHYGLLREIENNTLEDIDCQNIIGEVYACYEV